jgi:cbb3-type cytochrome oxidase subunit 3
MKLAAVIVLAFILVTLLIFLLAGLALSATRRARMRGENKGAMDFSDSETVQFTREILEARKLRQEDLDDEEDGPGSL